MTDSMNLDSSDIGTLDDFDSLRTIQAELDILNEQVHDNGKVVIAPAHMEIIPNILPKEELDIKNEDSEQMDEDDLGEEMITDNMMEDAISNEMMQDVMEMHEDEHDLQTEHIDTINNVIRHDNHSLFSEGVIEEIIEDEQVIKEETPIIYENVEQISQDQILEEKTDYVDDIMDNNVVTEETIIESGEVEDKTLDKEMEVSQTEMPLKQAVQPEPQLKQIRFQQIQQPVVVSSVSSPSISVPSGVYVVNTSKGQSLIQGNAIFTTKDASKMTRVLTLPTTMDGSATMAGGQTIRIVAPQGKVLSGLGGVGKTFTFEQARKMGLISQSSINQILPNAKTVTVMKSPAKILPAPPPNVQNKGGNQKVLIRHANTLKPGTILTTTTPGQVIRLPSNQTLTTHLQLPGGAKQVQYVKLIGGTGNKTLLPVSLSKTIPVAALSTSLLNTGQTTYKVVPISTPQTATTVNATPQRVLIPANTVQTTSAQAQNMNNVLMIQSNLVQVKKISPKEEPKPQATQAATPLSPDTANANVVNNSTKEPKTEYLSGDEIIEANGIRPRKPCNCTKSMCLKLYCDCFANGEFCNMCNCTTCYNNLEHEEERQAAIKSCLERNPAAFRPKIGKTFIGSEERRHNKGCNCRRSGCLKNYCECYEAKIPCSKNCKCIGCKNLESYINKRGPTAEERLRAKDAINQIKSEYDQHSGGQSKIFKQAFNLMTNEVIQATCQCLIAQAEEWNTATVERAQAEIIEEFGRCIVQIIDTVAKSLGTQQPLPSNS